MNHKKSDDDKKGGLLRLKKDDSKDPKDANEAIRRHLKKNDPVEK
jgi:hypothetical protein